MPVLREELAPGIVIYCADVRDILGEIEADALITDPPYGVGLGTADVAPEDGIRRLNFRRVPHMHQHRVDGGYLSYDDTPENFATQIAPTIPLLLARCKRGAVFMSAKNFHLMPPVDTLAGVLLPGGTGRTAWGFLIFHPVLLYGNTYPGSSPKPLIFKNSESRPIINGHPVPKRISWMRWLVDLASLEDEVVLDPYMGSGTTGVACIELGRKFIGVEIERQYYDIARRRLVEALNEPSFFPRIRPVREYLTGLDDPRHTRALPRVRMIPRE